MVAIAIDGLQYWTWQLTCRPRELTLTLLVTGGPGWLSWQMLILIMERQAGSLPSLYPDSRFITNKCIKILWKSHFKGQSQQKQIPASNPTHKNEPESPKRPNPSSYNNSNNNCLPAGQSNNKAKVNIIIFNIFAFSLLGRTSFCLGAGVGADVAVAFAFVSGCKAVKCRAAPRQDFTRGICAGEWCSVFVCVWESLGAAASCDEPLEM